MLLLRSIMLLGLLVILVLLELLVLLVLVRTGEVMAVPAVNAARC